MIPILNATYIWVNILQSREWLEFKHSCCLLSSWFPFNLFIFKYFNWRILLVYKIILPEIKVFIIYKAFLSPKIYIYETKVYLESRGTSILNEFIEFLLRDRQRLFLSKVAKWSDISDRFISDLNKISLSVFYKI